MEINNYKIGDSLTEIQAMDYAIKVAQGGIGRVAPNPIVGCVILDSQNRFLSSGYHEFYGGPHAEINTLKKVKESDLKGAKVFVTLEPCSHEGKTPSCAKALAQLPIAAVFYGVEDPNPLVQGQGVEILKSAGIKTIHLKQAQADCERLAEIFLWNMRKNLPFVCIKMASSLDGQIALKNGESQWITGEDARDHVHFLRAQYDAIVVGRSTIDKDNPFLNIRHKDFKDKKNKVVILDSKGKLLKKITRLNISKVRDLKDVYLVVSEKTKIKSAPCNILRAKNKNGVFDLSSVLQKCWEAGIKSLYVEGGAVTASHFIKQSCVNKMYLYLSMSLIGNGILWTQKIKINELSERYYLKDYKIQNFDSDILLSGYFK